MKELLALIGAIIGPLLVVIAFLYKRGEAKNKANNQALLDLTRSFVDTTKDCTRAIENNTHVINKLPETIMLHLAAERNKSRQW